MTYLLTVDNEILMLCIKYRMCNTLKQPQKNHLFKLILLRKGIHKARKKIQMHQPRRLMICILVNKRNRWRDQITRLKGEF